MNEHNLPDLALLLTSHFKSEVKILKQYIELLTGPGEHYGSIMLKVDLECSVSNCPKLLNLAAKCIPVSEILQKAFDVQVTFKKELYAYAIAIPTLSDFQKEHGVPGEEFHDLFPPFYGGRCNLQMNDGKVDEHAVLLFENLKTKGYQTIDRGLGYDLSTAENILSILARFHAVPLAFRILKPKEFEMKISPCLIQHGKTERLDEELINAFDDSILSTASKCQELKPFMAKIQEIVEYNKTHPFIHRPKPSEEYGTITHCDLWTSNIMISHGETGVKSKFLDLQLMNFYSPISDLIFFLTTSVRKDVLDDNFEHFIRFYHEHFIAILKSFGIDLKPYTWEKFKEELESVAPREVIHVLLMLKIICAEKDKITNTIDNFDISDWTREDIIGDFHKNRLRDTILFFASKNWL